AQLGATLARLHAVAAFEQTTDYTIENLCYRELPARAHGLPFETEFTALVDAIAFRPDARRTAIHSDPSPINSIATDAGLVLVDWECAGSGHPLIDLGGPLITQLFGRDLRFDRDAAVAFYSAYRDEGGQLPEPRDVLAVGMMIALSYLPFGDLEQN